MGTSTYRKSPATAAWDHVRDAYREGVSDPAEVSRRIVLAVDDATRDAMRSPGVALTLDTLLAGARAAQETPAPPPMTGVSTALQAAAALRRAAERDIASQGLASRFTDIALDALGRSTLQFTCAGTPEPDMLRNPLPVFARACDEGRLHVLANSFLGADLGACFEYFVSRDIHEFVGTSAYPSVLDARRLTKDVGEFCARTSVARWPVPRGRVGARGRR